MMGNDKFVLMYKDQTRPEWLEQRIMESHRIGYANDINSPTPPLTTKRRLQGLLSIDSMS